MKILKLIAAFMLGLNLTAQSAIFYQGTAVSGGTSAGVGSFNQTIADGNLAGTWNQISVSGLGSSFSSLTVTLNVAGGYNGDLYAYLSYGGQSVVLLNRIGVSSGNAFGSSGAGMDVTLSDAAAGNIHAAGNGVLSGSYQADGQNISPISSAASFNANGGVITLGGTFGSMDPNGTWTLFFADAVAGGGSATLNGWSLDISAVPEPTNVALGILAAGFLGFAGVRHFRRV